MHRPQFCGLVCDSHASVHGLHAQDLIVALLVVEHGGGKVIKDIVRVQRPVRLAVYIIHSIRAVACLARSTATHLYPLVPDEKAMAVVVGRMEIIYIHWRWWL